MDFSRSPNFDVNLNGNTTRVEARMAIKGPNGEGLIEFEGEDNGGTVTFTELVVTPDGGAAVDLLAGAAPAGSGTAGAASGPAPTPTPAPAP